MRIYHDKDANFDVFDGKRIAVLGYGSQGRAQALCFRDSGLDVVVGARKDGKSWNKAKEDGLKVAEFADAVRQSDVIMMLLPDEIQPDIYKQYVEPNIKDGAALEFAHGFAITYKLIVPPEGVDVIMMAPKAPGDMERIVFTEGFGVPALICVYQDVTGNAKDIALGLAKGLGSTRAGVFETTFDNETFTDLFGEQAVLCGGQTELIKRGFETLVEAGYPPEMAYFEVLHETKLIVDLINKGGFDLMWDVVSNTAEYGGMTRRERVVTQQSKDAMVQILKEIEDGTFKTQWRGEWENGLVNLKRMEAEEKQLQVEVVGKEIRRLFERKDRIRFPGWRGMSNFITIRSRAGEFRAELDESDISNTIWLSKPLTFEINMIGGMVYGELPLAAVMPREGRTTKLSVGDVAYWPGPGAFCIFYGPTPLSGDDGEPVAPYPVIKIGRMVGDCSALEDAGDRQKITIVPGFRSCGRYLGGCDGAVVLQR